MGNSMVDRMQKNKETDQIANELHTKVNLVYANVPSSLLKVISVRDSEVPVSVRDVDFMQINEEING